MSTSKTFWIQTGLKVVICFKHYTLFTLWKMKLFIEQPQPQESMGKKRQTKKKKKKEGGGKNKW